MEDYKIKELFQNFQPELSSDSLFMSRLKSNMQSVELVKQQTARLQHRNRIAVTMASLAGCIVGIVMTIWFPYISQWVSTINVSLPSLGLSSVKFEGNIITWLISAALIVFTSLNTYAITMNDLAQKILSHK